MGTETAPDKRYEYALLQTGSLPLGPDNIIRSYIEHKCTSVLLWPEGEQPSASNTVLVDPCFTEQGFQHAIEELERLGLALTDIGHIFVTHQHDDHMLCLPSDIAQPEFAHFQVSEEDSNSHSGPLSGLSTVPCPGHSWDSQALTFRLSSGQNVWIVGDAILNAKWLKAWAYYWPNAYISSEIAQTWRSAANILSQADLIIPGHGAPIPVTASLVKELLLAFPTAKHARKCPEVERVLNERLRQWWKGTLLEELTWVEAEKVLDEATVVVIPLGAAAKEHGPHLKLKNDWIIAEHFKQQVLEKAEVVVAPTVPYHFYPAFLEYPGSISLRPETARDLIVDICRSLAEYGPRRFYVLNTGISTLRPLEAAARLLAADGILLHHTDVSKVAKPVEEELAQQERGTHADEIETSMMLYIAPDSVDMSKAAKDGLRKGYSLERGRLTRNPGGKGTYSATGIYGDATLASHEKGKKIVEAHLEGILKNIEKLRNSPLPAEQGGREKT